MSFSLKKNDNGNWVEVTNNYATVLEPNDQVRLDCEASDYNNLSDIHIYVSTDKEEAQIELENTFSTSNIFSIPELYSSNHTINFTIEGIDSSSEAGVTSTTLTLNNYNCPVKFSVEQALFQRVPENYSEPSVNGTYMKAENIQFVLDSGVLSDITDIQIKIYKDNNFESEVIVDRQVIIIDFFDYDGYQDGHSYQSDINPTYLFNDINISDDNPFKDTTAKFYFSFILTYKKLKPNSGGNEWDYEYDLVTEESQRYIYRRGITSLYLVGKTELDNGNNVYGGVSIGKKPNIKNIGQAAFECGYPAYFSDKLYVNNYQYGFYAGNTIAFSDSETPFIGLITGSRKTIAFTVCLGQPIFANRVSGSGNMIIRLSEGGYINEASASSSTLKLSDFTATIINKQAGIIKFRRAINSEYKKYTSSSSSGTTVVNNQVLAVCITNGKIIFS